MKKSRIDMGAKNSRISTGNRNVKELSHFVFLLLLILGIGLSVDAQQNTEQAAGEISFISGSNVYVRLPSDSPQQAGDTLFQFLGGKKIPALLIKQRSSLSCLSNPIADFKPEVGMKMYSSANQVYPHKVEKLEKEKIETREELKEEEKEEEVPAQNAVVILPVEPKTERSEAKKSPEGENKKEGKIHGRIRTLAMLDLPSGDFEGRNNFRHSLYLTGNDLITKGLSAEAYLQMNHNEALFSADSLHPKTGFRAFSLNMQYSGKDHFVLGLGRKIHSKLSNIGPNDGLWVEKKFGAFGVGAMAGYRPDWKDFSFNSDLFQYGVFVTFDHTGKGSNYQHSLAFMEQTNQGNTDRRFLYGQSNGRFTPKLSYLASVELDLYRMQNDTASTSLRLTGLYLNLNWQLNRKLSLSASYNARQPIIFYETYRSEVDELLDRELNQGLRFRMNYRPWKFMQLNLNGGIRYEKGDLSPAMHYSAAMSLRNLPMNGVTSTLSASQNRSSYFNADILGLRFQGDILPGKLSAGISYRYLQYHSTMESTILPQHMAELQLEYRISKNWQASLNYELIQQKDFPHNRLFLQVRYRF